MGGNGPQAMPVVIVKPKAAGLAWTSASSENASTGITRMPVEARPVTSVVL